MYEHKVLRRLDAKHREDFLNKTNGRDWQQSSTGRFWIRNHPDKDLATEVKYLKVGEPIPDGWFKGFLASSENQKEVAKNLWLGRNHKPETIMKMRENNLGEKNPNFGRIYSEEDREKYRMCAPKGKNNPTFTGYWVMPHGTFTTKNEAIENSEFKISHDTIIKWCKTQNSNVIKRSNYVGSAYLQGCFSFEECVGKTFQEIGFGFAPIS